MGRSGVLLAERNELARRGLSDRLRDAGYDVTLAGDEDEAIRALSGGTFALLVGSAAVLGADGGRLVRTARELAPQTLVVIASNGATRRFAARALRDARPDYLFTNDHPGELAERLLDLLECRSVTTNGTTGRAELPFLVARSAAMQRVRALLEHVAPTGATVLLIGESGTGKEVLARAIHQLGRADDSVFLPINCAAIPDALLEAQLFGHLRGSFTGAESAREGFFHRAHGGTLLLDEIGELSLAMQVKLLRVIEEKEIIPIGATAPIPVDVRVIASTNRDLRRAVAEGTFREDLYYRLNVVRVDVPPLRERPEDILPLVEFMIERHNRSLGHRYRGVTHEALEAMKTHDWPGNVRELGHAIEYGMIVGDGDWIDVADLPVDVRQSRASAPAEPESLAEALKRFERAYLENLVRSEGGNRRELAARLQIDPSTLYRKLQAFGIKTED